MRGCRHALWHSVPDPGQARAASRTARRPRIPAGKKRLWRGTYNLAAAGAPAGRYSHSAMYEPRRPYASGPPTHSSLVQVGSHACA